MRFRGSKATDTPLASNSQSCGTCSKNAALPPINDHSTGLTSSQR